MPFHIVSGKMGGGKSYYGAEFAIKGWEEGAIVHSNLAFKDEEVIKRGYIDLYVKLTDNPDDWLSQLKAGVEGRENILIVDEGSLMFGALDHAEGKAMKRKVFQFMAHSRKMGMDVLFISQHPKNIDAQIRRLAHGLVQCVQTAKVPPIGWLIAIVLGGFARYFTDPTGKTVYSTQYCRFNPSVGEIYATDATHGQFSTLERQVTRRAKADGAVTRNKLLLATFAILISLSLAYGVYGANTLWSKYAGEEPAPAEVAPAVKPAPAAIAPPIAASAPAAPKEPRFIPRSGMGVDARGNRFVWFRGERDAKVGGEWRDAIVKRMDRSGDIVTIYLDDGRVFRTRSRTRADDAAEPKPDKSWIPKLPFSSNFSAPSSSALRSLGSGAPAGKP